MFVLLMIAVPIVPNLFHSIYFKKKAFYLLGERFSILYTLKITRLHPRSYFPVHLNAIVCTRVPFHF